MKLSKSDISIVLLALKLAEQEEESFIDAHSHPYKSGKFIDMPTVRRTRKTIGRLRRLRTKILDHNARIEEPRP